MEWMVMPLRRYFEFGGRSRRLEFWLFSLFVIVVSLIAGAIDAALGYGRADVTRTATTAAAGFRSNGPVGGIVSLAVLIPSLAVSIRRLHDTDRSGWWILLSFVPIIGWIVLLIFYCQNGTDGPNAYGDDPKGVDYGAVFG